MCGILGYVFRGDNYNNKLFINNLDLLKNRGPDNSGYYWDRIEQLNLFLGHRRLSVIDLSIAANQPMTKNNKGTIVFNGEVYNHNELRKKYLQKIDISSTSDTETLINLVQQMPFEFVLNKIEGMFAFSYYDKNNHKLLLARDRSGEKPLYICINSKYFGFSSDIRVFKEIDSNFSRINENAIQSYLNLNYIPNPITIYENCFKIPPASFLEIDLKKINLNKCNTFNDFINSKGVVYKQWWRIENNYNDLKKTNYLDIREKTAKILESAVKKQIISDVPIGSFLSSGVDSSLVSAFMSKFVSNLKTFTIGFNMQDFDESKKAKKIARILKTDHHELIFNKEDLLNTIPSLNDVFSEPFADSSQLPTLLISKFASKKLKVVLTGDGGDELFGGYNRYILANKYWHLIKILPVNLRIVLLKALKYLPLKIIIWLLPSLFNKKNELSFIENKLLKILDKLIYINSEFSYYYSMTNNMSSSKIMKNQKNEFNYTSQLFSNQKEFNFEQKMMNVDFQTYLTDDILCKVDRTSMHYSLEARAPFLDPQLINHAINIPKEYKFKNNYSKYILRDILSKFIPSNQIENIKKGFALPISFWLKNDLKDWCKDILSKEICSKHNFFNAEEVENIMKDHFNGVSNNEHKLWALIQFNDWYIKNYEN